MIEIPAFPPANRLTVSYRSKKKARGNRGLEKASPLQIGDLGSIFGPIR
jgi:hypothetical protein